MRKRKKAKKLSQAHRIRPDLSVAIIFKNEMRCLERCLRSLQPLRERLSLEIVMADTGSDDGSRAVAERYADVLFDFPWIDDFSAARNAVLDRCTGRWALVMDCDEWLDTDADSSDKMIELVRGGKEVPCDGAVVTVRSYLLDDRSAWSDVLLTRLLRLAAGPRFVGAIHERAEFPGKAILRGDSVLLLKHDGYVMLNDGSEAGKEKVQRNLALIRRELEREPENLERLMQFFDTGEDEPDYLEKIRLGVTLVLAKKPGWNRWGSAILRAAVKAAYNAKLTELTEWAVAMRRLFPDSALTQIDLPYYLMFAARDRGDWNAAAAQAETYLRGVEAFQRRRQRDELRYCTLRAYGDIFFRDVRLLLSEAYAGLGRAEDALSCLRAADWSSLDADTTDFAVRLLMRLHKECGADIGPLLSECWEGINRPVPSPDRAAERAAVFRRLVRVEDAYSGEDAQRELAALAAKVKAILDRLPPDDPIALDLINSAAYRKVAHMIGG